SVGPSARYSGTLPDPSGGATSRSSLANAAGEKSGVSAVPAMMAVNVSAQRLMAAHLMGDHPSAQRMVSAVGRWSIIRRSAVLGGAGVHRGGPVGGGSGGGRVLGGGWWRRHRAEAAEELRVVVGRQRAGWRGRGRPRFPSAGRSAQPEVQ